LCDDLSGLAGTLATLIARTQLTAQAAQVSNAGFTNTVPNLAVGYAFADADVHIEVTLDELDDILIQTRTAINSKSMAVAVGFCWAFRLGLYICDC
jgi:hypothetical protein